MDKYLIEILKEVNTIIIPELGALTIVNHATGEIMFMPYLKFDDGKLSKHISEREGWEENEAKNLIAKYVREVRTKLDQGETYDIYKVGSFFKNEEGDVDFRVWETDGTDSDTTTTPVVTETPVVETAPEPETTVETDEQEMTPPPVEPTPVVAEQETPAEEQKPEPAVAEETTQEVKQDPESKVIPEEEQWKDDLDVPPVNYQKEIPKKPILEKAEKDKKKKKRGAGFYILLAVLVLLVGGGTYFGLHYNEFKQYVPFLADKQEVNEEPEPETSDEQAEEEMPDETMSSTDEPEATQEPTGETEAVEDKAEEQPIEPTPAPVTSSSGLRVDKSLPIQVIAGSFAEESNASGLVDQYKKNGYNAAIIGQYDLLYFVSIASFENMESYNASKSAVNSVSQKYWIFRK